MTHHFFKTALICAVALLPAGAVQDAREAKLKADLEIVYNTWRQAMVRQNYEIWQQATSAQRQMKVRNLAVSEKRPFPASLFNQRIAPASLTPLRYIGMVVKGPTAAVTYFGKVDWNIGGEPTENALVLLFNHENGTWKYDQSRFFNLTKLPAVRQRLKNGDASVLTEQDGFQPLGSIPPVPPACPKPKYIAKVFADCPGRTINITINNVSPHSFSNISDAEIISGGLRGGSNDITITATPIPDSKDKGPAFIGVYIMPEVKGETPGIPFTYSIPADQTEAVRHSASFTVTPEVLAKMKQGAPKAKTAK